MTHVNLDSQPELIRQFVLAIAAKSGAVLESSGKPVACLFPPPRLPNTKAEHGPWTEEMNERRCELIDRKYDQGLSAIEEAELLLLQDAMYRFVDRVAPLPMHATQELLAELLRKASQTERDENK